MRWASREEYSTSTRILSAQPGAKRKIYRAAPRGILSGRYRLVLLSALEGRRSSVGNTRAANSQKMLACVAEI